MKKVVSVVADPSIVKAVLSIKTIGGVNPRPIEVPVVVLDILQFASAS
jgi:hypothetical protein